MLQGYGLKIEIQRRRLEREVFVNPLSPKSDQHQYFSL